MQSHKVKVLIRCRKCGERFILKGKQDKGRIETGFRQCICNNEDDFEMETDPE
jgi:DNA-directed RNA polymerase subunit RPC12/RpoP